MNLSPETIKILQQFSNINNSLYFDEPGYLKIKSPNSSSIIGVAKIEEELPTMAIYSLNEFLGSISLLNEVEFSFDNNYIVIKEDNVKIKYRLSDPAHILSQCKSAEDYKAYDDFDCILSLTHEQIQSISKASKILSADVFKIIMEDGKGLISLINSEMPMSNSFEMKIEGSGTGSAKFFVDNLIIFPGDYTVHVSTDKVLKFVNNDQDIFYFLSCAEIE